MAKLASRGQSQVNVLIFQHFAPPSTFAFEISTPAPHLPNPAACCLALQLNWPQRHSQSKFPKLKRLKFAEKKTGILNLHGLKSKMISSFYWKTQYGHDFGGIFFGVHFIRGQMWC